MLNSIQLRIIEIITEIYTKLMGTVGSNKID